MRATAQRINTFGIKIGWNFIAALSVVVLLTGLQQIQTFEKEWV